VQAANFNRLLALQMQIRLFASDEIIESAKKLTSEVLHSFVKKMKALVNLGKELKHLVNCVGENLI